ncbi:MAG TPA: hypothetical protein VFH95_16205 [Candidatus Kapabacteria bacterium]|nr:hypothetical protein [Candidatus Kapabacteria bacterium]
MGFKMFSRKETAILSGFSLFAFLIRIPLALRPIRALAGFPYGDDAFYLFSIAKHFAAGQGFSVDGLHLTNGFQPLVVLLYAPIFWLCGTNAWLAVRWTLILNGVIAALFVWAVAAFIRTIERAPNPKSVSIPVVAAALWTFTYPLFVQMANGLETSLASLLLLIALILYAKESSKQEDVPSTGVADAPSRWWLLGIVLGFTVLARIDAAIFVAILVLLLFLRKQPRAAMVTGAIAFLISLPWWIFNWVYFGSLMPTSGQAENIWPLPPHENIYRATQAVSGILSLVFYLPHSLSFLASVCWLLMLLAGIVFLTYRAHLTDNIRRLLLRMNALVPLAIFSITLFFYYTFFFRAPHFLERYFQPARILWSILAAAGAGILWREKRARTLLIAAAIIGLAFSIDRFAADYYLVSRTSDFYDMGGWANAHPNEKIGMLQSGIASFVAPNIINLDGKVNADALRAHQQGRLADYLRDQHFTYIADEKPFIEDIAAIARKDKLFFDSTGMIGHIQLMKRRDDSE